ncbi:MAG: LytR C-terminal domain-containing protein [Nocardioides sp.]
MTQGMRSAITIAVLSLLLVVAAIWGWSAATKPLPGKVDTPICVDQVIAEGEKVFPQDVTVSVYNAGSRDGLAGLVMQELTEAGFHQGNGGNAAPTVRVSKVQIWTEDPTSPDVRLVASRLGKKVQIESRTGPGAGVTVVVGDKFGETRKGRKAVVAEADVEICSPPVG